MRVQHNIAAVNAYRNFNVNNNKLSKNLEKLSSGYAINRAADDAAGLSVSEKMRKEISGLDADLKNAKNGISFVQAADGALAEVHDTLNRMYYLAQEKSGGVGIYSQEDNQQAFGDEMTALAKEINRIYTDTKFNGSQVLADITVGFSGGGNINAIPEAADDEKNVLDDFVDLLDGKEGTFDTTAEDFDGGAIGADAIESAITIVSKLRSAYGAAQNRLEHTVNNLSTVRENMVNAESTVRDTDVAEEMMKYTKNSIMNQAAQAMLAQANQSPQGVLQLLQ